MARDIQTEESGKTEEVMAIAAQHRGVGTFSSLAHRDFRYLWVSVLFSSCGQWFEQVTLSWLVYDMTDSPVMLGLVNGLRAVPFLIFGPFGGVAADRMDRKKLMMATQVILTVTAFVMGLLVLTGLVEVWHVFVFTVVNGTAWSFNMPVRQALVPNLVPNESLMNAIALNSTAFNLTRVIGPSVGGLLIGVLGTSGNFFVQGCAYIGVMVMIQLMTVPPYSGSAKESSVSENLMEGLRYVRHQQVVLTLIIMALIPMVFSSPYLTLMPIFARDVLKIGAEGLGLLMSATGLGALAGTLTLASLGSFRRKGALLIATAMALGIFLILFGASEWVLLTVIFLMGVGATQMVYFATNNTLLQLTIPDELRGRVMAIYMLDQGLTPAGTLIAGAMAAVLGAPLTVQIMGVIVSLLALSVLIGLPYVRRLE